MEEIQRDPGRGGPRAWRDATMDTGRGRHGWYVHDDREPFDRSIARATASSVPDAGPPALALIASRKTLEQRWAKAHLGGGEHATAAAHVSERTLARAVGTTTGDTGNTGHGATGTPGLSRSLLLVVGVGVGVVVEVVVATCGKAMR